MSSEYLVDREITDALKALGRELRATKGKHTYKFLPPPLKVQVDNVLERVTQRDPVLRSMYEEYLDSQKELVLTYASNEETLDKNSRRSKTVSFIHTAASRTSAQGAPRSHGTISSYRLPSGTPGQQYGKNQLRTVHAKVNVGATSK